MKDHYVSYECAKNMKALGFTEKVKAYYCFFQNGELKLWDVAYPKDHNARKSHNENFICSAPRLDQAQAWLREVKGIDIEVVALLDPFKKTKRYKTNLCYFSKDESGEDYANYKVACLNIHSYEKALELGISNALELLGKEENFTNNDSGK